MVINRIEELILKGIFPLKGNLIERPKFEDLILERLLRVTELSFGMLRSSRRESDALKNAVVRDAQFFGAGTKEISISLDAGSDLVNSGFNGFRKGSADDIVEHYFRLYFRYK